MKRILLLVVAVAFFGSVKAQSDLNFGPKVGLNVTNLTNYFDMNNKASIHIGGFANVKFTDFVGMQIELLYSGQGARDKYDYEGSKVKEMIRVNYLNIPVLARLNVWDRFNVEVGPQLEFALNAKDVLKVGDATTKVKLHNLNTVGLSLAVGASYELDMGIMFSARYNIGLTNVLDKDVIGKSNKNHVFQLSVGYKLNF